MNVMNKEATGLQYTVAQIGQERKGWAEASQVTHKDQIYKLLGKSTSTFFFFNLFLDNVGKRLKTKGNDKGHIK